MTVGSIAKALDMSPANIFKNFGSKAGLIDAVAFRKLDQRLAAALLGHGSDLATTHQALADELGTVREIVTRLLRRFEREGWVELAREHIRIVDSGALRTLASALQT